MLVTPLVSQTLICPCMASALLELSHHAATLSFKSGIALVTHEASSDPEQPSNMFAKESASLRSQQSSWSKEEAEENIPHMSVTRLTSHAETSLLKA